MSSCRRLGVEDLEKDSALVIAIVPSSLLLFQYPLLCLISPSPVLLLERLIRGHYQATLELSLNEIAWSGEVGCFLAVEMEKKGPLLSELEIFFLCLNRARQCVDGNPRAATVCRRRKVSVNKVALSSRFAGKRSLRLLRRVFLPQWR